MGRQRTIPKQFKPEFDALKNAIHRCHNPDHQSFYNYGERGISVQDKLRTKDGWKLLIETIGPRPGTLYSLDRIDNDGDYTVEPLNLKWSTRKEQQNNRRKQNRSATDYGWGFDASGKSALLEHQGRIQSVAEWARELNINPATIRHRLRRGMNVVDALNPSTSRTGEKHRPSGFLLINPTIH